MIILLRLKEIFPNKKKSGGGKEESGGRERERKGGKGVEQWRRKGGAREGRKKGGRKERGREDMCADPHPLLKMHKFRLQAFRSTIATSTTVYLPNFFI